MVAIFTGAGTGVERGSARVLGAQGVLGSAAIGRGGEQMLLNAATGNLVIQRQDEFLTGRDLDIPEVRTYNSLGDLSDANHDNWRFSPDRRVYGLTGQPNSTGSSVHRISADGSDITYSYDGTKYVTTDGSGPYDSLTYNGATWTWTDAASQVTETYSASGTQWRLSKQTDADGYSLTFLYTASGQISRVATATGEYVQYDYDSTGTEVVDLLTGYIDHATGTAATLTRTRYEYDPTSNRLKSVTVDLSPNDNDVTDGQVYKTAYTYDTAGHVISISQSDGSRVDITYDTSSRVKTVVETVAAGVSRTTTLSYGAGFTSITDPVGQITRLDYDPNKNLTKITLPAASAGASPQVTQFQYDTKGNVASVIDAAGNTTVYTYDLQGNATSVTDRTGNVVTRTYGARNELLTETSVGSDDAATASIHSTRYVYDAENHLHYEITPEGHVTEYRYTVTGQVQFTIEYPEQVYDVSALASGQAPTESDMNAWRDAIVDKSSTKVTYDIYDTRGNLLQERRYSIANADGTGSMADGSTGDYFTYDQAGKLLTRHSGTQNSESFVYDGLGRLVSAVDVNGGTATYVFGDPGIGSDNPTTTTVTLANGRVQSSTFSKTGELLSYSESGSATSPPPSTGEAQYAYDRAGRIRWGTDLAGNRSYSLYDNAGRKTADIGATGEMVEYQYDADDRIIARTRYATPLTSAQLASLDNADIPAEVSSFRPPSSSSDMWDWTVYDKEGRVLQTIAGDGSTTVSTYDGEGKLLQSTQYANKFSASVLAGFKTNPPTDVTTSTSTTTTTTTTNYTVSGNLMPDLSNSTQWTEGAGISQAAGPVINSQPSWTYTLPAGTGALRPVEATIGVQAGDTLTWTVTVMDAGGQQSHQMGFVTGGTASAPTGVGGATIVSGPGSLTHGANGLWTLTGISASQATTLTFTHTFSASALVNLATFLQRGVTAGDAIILSNPSVTISTEATATEGASANLLPDLSNGAQWTETNLTQTQASAISGHPAWLYTTSTSGMAAYVNGKVSVDAGETLSWTVTLMASGTTTQDVIGLSSDGDVSGLGLMTLVSGPGAVAAGKLGYWVVSGLSTTVPTTVTISHTFPAAATVDLQAHVHFNGDVGENAGDACILSNPIVTTASSTTTTTTGGTSLASANDRTSRCFYDEDGRLVGTLDAAGYVTRKVYDDAGQTTEEIAYANLSAATYRASGTFSQILATVTASSTKDRHTHYAYNGQGQLRFAIDAENYVSETRFDTAGQPTSVTRYANGIAAATTDFTYDSVKTLVAAAGFASPTKDQTDWSVYDGSGRLAYAIGAEGAVTGYDYDTSGQLIKLTRFSATRSTTALPSLAAMDSWAATNGNPASDSITRNYYDGSGTLRYVVDAEGYVTRRTEDPNGRLVSVGRFGSALTVTDSDTIGTLDAAVAASAGSAVTTGTSYDVDGRVSATTDAAGSVTSFVYDAFGNVVKITDPRGNVSYNYYDALGRLTMSCDALKYVTETAYDPFGGVASVTRRYNAATNAPSASVPPAVTADSARDATTSFTYDRLGQLIKTTDAEGNSESYSLDSFGNRVTVVNKLGGTTTNAYDRLGRLVSETLPMASVNKSGTQVAATVTNTYSYDARGNRTQMVEASGLAEQRTSNYLYDRADRLVSKTGDAVTKISYNDFTSTNAVVVTTASVVPAESYNYDARGNLILATDANGAKTYSYYDQLDRKIAQVDALGTLTTWGYDSAGNQVSQTIYGDFVALPATAGGTPPVPIDASNCRTTTYGYDALNRLTSTSVAGVLVGTWNSANNGVSRSTVTVSSGLDYDANGNVIASTDQNGNKTYSWYDKLNRRTDQLDAAGYLTHWTYDDEGNVLSERRYATKWTGAISTSVPPAVATSATADRVTTFTYDQNGHRLTETRTGVTAWTVNSSNGVLTAASSSSTVTYAYNALDEVVSKKEATGDTVAYTYDKSGRLSTETRSAFANQLGTSVTPTVHYYYNGLNNLTRTQQGGAAIDNVNDRITTYVYGAGGRLASMTDAAGGTHNYDYDAAGNQVRDSYARTTSSGASVTEGILYRRDLLSRVVTQTIATQGTATSWTRGDSQNIQYDAFGEVSQRGVNGLWQESFAYDNRGLLQKSNSGDGVWRFHVYDKAGNEVLTVESEGNDYSATSLSTVLTALGTYGTTFVSGVNATISVYDARNQLVQVRQPQRETSGQSAPLTTFITTQTYNAFGEVASETDPIGNLQGTQAGKDAHTTYFSYNAMGRLIQKVMPTVGAMNSSGTVAPATPTENYYYDLSGREVATKDANGNTISKTLLAGTGYGGTDAEVTAEFHPDGGVARTFYDVFGDAVTLRDELGYDETRSYDDMGRLVTQAHRSYTNSAGALLQLTDNYSYDLLGQRISHWNSQLGATVKETTDYDLQGRVVSHVALGGDAVATTYVWSSALVTSGFGTFGGWTQTDTYANGKTMVAASDLFGNDLSKTDLGGHAFSFAYDKAGRQVGRTVGTETLTTAYFNTGLVSKLSTGANDYTTSTYDADGNKLTEYTVRGGVVAQNATATYDALNRMTSWSEAGGSIAPISSKTLEYDLNGNIRADLGRMNDFDPQGNAIGQTSQNDYYAYDSMNRVVNGDGTTNYYDAAGQRVRVDRQSDQRSTKVLNPNWNEVSLSDKFITVYYTVPTREDYTFNADGTLKQVQYAEGTAQDDGSGGITINAPSGPGAVISSFTYDAMGHATRHIDYMSDGSVAYDDSSVYNSKGQVTSETVTAKRRQSTTTSYDTYTDYTTNNYGTGSTYALGQVVQVDDDAWKNGSDSGAPDTRTVNGYAWYDGAVQSTTTFTPDTSGSTSWVSTYSLTQSGVLNSVAINDGRPRTVSFVNDMNGAVIRRDETDGISTQGDPHTVDYRFDGKEIGRVANTANQDRLGYTASIADRQAPPPDPNNYSFLYLGAPLADLSYDATNSYRQGADAGNWTVQAGDTLQSIAQAVWGDSSLWYKIAEGNGLTSDGMLVQGQSLQLPAGVTRSKNNASTFTPYDPAQAIGNTSPTKAPKPPKHNNCGAFGQVLLAAIQVAVTVALSFTPVGPVGAAVIGDLVKQGVGLATGIQAGGFSLKEAAITALSAGLAPPGTGNVVADAANAAVTNAEVQGIAIATGLQDKFDWAGVAAAGVSAGVGTAVGSALKTSSNPVFKSAGSIGNIASRSAAAAIANAATRTLINGTDFGDNLLAGLPDVIGQTIGGIVADGVAGRRSAGAGTSPGGTAAADTATAKEPVPGEGGGQVGDDQTIVVTGTRHRDWTPAQWAAASAAQEARWAAEEAAGAGAPALPPAPHTDVNYAIDINTHNARLGQWGPWVAANDPTLTKYDYSDVIAGFQAEEQYIMAVNAAAAPELNRVDMVFGGLMALQAAPAAIPLIAGGSVVGAAAGGVAFAADANQASGIGAIFGQNRLALDYIRPGASDGLNQVALVTGAVAGAWSLGRVASLRAPSSFAQIRTPWGPALQSMAPEAMAARSTVENGATLYRLGTIGRSEAAEAQFWALEHPLSPGYAARYGIPPANVTKFDFIETATLKPGTPFVTRPAPGIGSNPGGGIEVVVPQNGVVLKYFGGH